MLIPGLVVMIVAILLMAGIPIITIIEDYKDYQNNKYDEWIDEYFDKYKSESEEE